MSEILQKTIRGYDFYEVSSAMQKAMRRNMPIQAGYFAIELFESGYHNYVWKRLLTFSAEDCDGMITQEIEALNRAFDKLNENTNSAKKIGRVFIAKAVLLLCRWPKNRDPFNVAGLVYDRRLEYSDQEIEDVLNVIREENEKIPEFVYDVNTKEGQNAGKTKEDFIKTEEKAMEPKSQTNIFGHLTEKI